MKDFNQAQQLYNDRYEQHRERGDDPVQARLRLLEDGASAEEAVRAQRAAGETDDSPDDELEEE